MREIRRLRNGWIIEVKSEAEYSPAVSVTVTKALIEQYENNPQDQVPELRGYRFQEVRIPVSEEEFKKTNLYHAMEHNVKIGVGVFKTEIAKYVEI